jgi:hypothetical protein
MYAADEFYEDVDDVPFPFASAGEWDNHPRVRPTTQTLEEALAPGCAWCEDWADGFDPDPCPHHAEVEA